MKKLGLLLICALCVLVLNGCGQKNVEGTLEDIMAKVYENVGDDEKPMMLENIPVNEENVEYYLGTQDIEFESVLASESGIGSVAHSVVLVRAKENANIEEIKTKIEENVNPRKWICVGIEKEEVIIKNQGNLIIVIIVQDETTREKISNSFDEL